MSFQCLPRVMGWFQFWSWYIWYYGHPSIQSWAWFWNDIFLGSHFWWSCLRIQVHRCRDWCWKPWKQVQLGPCRFPPTGLLKGHLKICEWSQMVRKRPRDGWNYTYLARNGEKWKETSHSWTIVTFFFFFHFSVFCEIAQPRFGEKQPWFGENSRDL